MNITVKYFASLRDKAGVSEEKMEISSEENLSRIYEILSSRYKFPLKAKEVKFAVNNEYVDDSYRLLENDVLVFIPPVAGG
jgi:molybdopterin synthase sulfur carrier subunit